MKNLFYLSVLIGILTVNIAIYPNMAAAAVSNEKNVSASDVRQRQGQQIDNKERARRLHKEYGVESYLLEQLLDKGHKYNELTTALLYAKLADAPLEKVLSLHQQSTWGRVRILLGLTADVFAKRNAEYQIKKLSGNDKSLAEKIKYYYKEGYSLNDIRTAKNLSVTYKQNIGEILPLKTAVNSWNDIEAALKHKQSKVIVTKQEVSHQRFGAGFAGLRIKNLTEDELINILHNDYQFPKEQLALLYKQLGFYETENVCLHAYMGRVPLAKVMQLREKYTWDKIKLLLGLTPKVYFSRCVDYQARRLAERMDIPKHVTKKYMYQGFAMHYINTAYLLSLESGYSIEEIMKCKTPFNRWSDVAVQLEIDLAKLQSVQDKITKAFKRG